MDVSDLVLAAFPDGPGGVGEPGAAGGPGSPGGLGLAGAPTIGWDGAPLDRPDPDADAAAIEIAQAGGGSIADTTPAYDGGADPYSALFESSVGDGRPLSPEARAAEAAAATELLIDERWSEIVWQGRVDAAGAAADAALAGAQAAGRLATAAVFGGEFDVATADGGVERRFLSAAEVRAMLIDGAVDGVAQTVDGALEALADPVGAAGALRDEVVRFAEGVDTRGRFADAVEEAFRVGDVSAETAAALRSGIELELVDDLATVAGVIPVVGRGRAALGVLADATPPAASWRDRERDDMTVAEEAVARAERAEGREEVDTETPVGTGGLGLTRMGRRPAQGDGAEVFRDMIRGRRDRFDGVTSIREVWARYRSDYDAAVARARDEGRRVPSPSGRRGGPRHFATVLEAQAQFRDPPFEHVAGGTLRERNFVLEGDRVRAVAPDLIFIRRADPSNPNDVDRLIMVEVGSDVGASAGDPRPNARERRGVRTLLEGRFQFREFPATDVYWGSYGPSARPRRD